MHLSALTAVNGGNTCAACGSLQTFLNEVRAPSGNELTTAQASQLTAAARQIQAWLGC